MKKKKLRAEIKLLEEKIKCYEEDGYRAREERFALEDLLFRVRKMLADRVTGDIGITFEGWVEGLEQYLEDSK